LGRIPKTYLGELIYMSFVPTEGYVDKIDQLSWSARHRVGNIVLSILQGEGCVGKKKLNTYEVYASDHFGEIPLFKSSVGASYTEKELISLIKMIANFDGDWAEHMRTISEANGIYANFKQFKSLGQQDIKDLVKSIKADKANNRKKTDGFIE
jgi:hypothetical protein